MTGWAAPRTPPFTRLNWACGPEPAKGWANSDAEWWPELRANFDPVHHPERSPGYARVVTDDEDTHIGEIQMGLPWDDGTFDYVVSHHGLMMLPEPDLIPALAELRRVTKPGGWLRVSVPDIWSAFWACRADDQGWFPVEADDTDEAFCRYVTQNGATRSVFTHNRLFRLIGKSGWAGVRGSSWRATWSPHEGITELDSRPGESLWMEAVNPG